MCALRYGFLIHSLQFSFNDEAYCSDLFVTGLNDDLVQQLMLRDDLHMEQDSMLVDIEDLHRYFQLSKFQAVAVF